MNCSRIYCSLMADGSRHRYGSAAKYLVFFFILLLFCSYVQGQSLAGITGKRDTSFSTNSAYRASKKTNPEAEFLPAFNDASIREKHNLVYSRMGNRKLLLDAFYQKEKSAGKKPAIVIIHGGGWRSGNRAQHHPLAQRLAQLGYVCFTPEYRLSTEALFPAAIYDVKEAIRWVRKHAGRYNVDTAKIVALGFSAGGQMAAFLGTTGNMPLFEGSISNNIPTHVNAVIDIDGTLSFVHPESGEGDDSKRTSAGTYWFGYSKKDNPTLWEAASPLSYASSRTPPTLFINSSVNRMHAGREDFIKILDQHKIYSEVRTFQNAPHSFCLFAPWFEPTVKYTDDFLKKVFTN